jgi:hypothetical protein
LLHSTILDCSEDFSLFFDGIELAFDNKIIDKRVFMSALLAGIESTS